jgi:hypothetical protein
LPRPCTVCAHPEAHTINVGLVSHSRNYRAMADEFGVSQTALKRHAADHLPALLAKAKEAVEVAEAGDLLSRIEALQSRTLAVLEAVEDTDNYGARLAAIKEARANLELIGRVTKELESGPTFNLYLSPEWLELRAVIVSALEPYSGARESVLSAIEGASNGNGWHGS